jgi:hypothetical protein
MKSAAGFCVGGRLSSIPRFMFGFIMSAIKRVLATAPAGPVALAGIMP